MRCLRGAYNFLLLLLLLNFQVNILSSANSPPSCSPDEAATLIQFKSSFFIDQISSFSFLCNGTQTKSYPKTDSWKEGTDCCEWDGVSCDNSTSQSHRHVIGLDLSCSWLYGTIPSNSTLFNLQHLRKLNLAFNNFNRSDMSSKFGEFSSLEHLNLSYTFFEGVFPSSQISCQSWFPSISLRVLINPLSNRLWKDLFTT